MQNTSSSPTRRLLGSLPGRILLPLAQLVAEGAWLAVVYAALQAVAGGRVWVGPMEFALCAWAGLAWGRRRRWNGPVAEALGLPLLAIAVGATTWLLDPVVRILLAEGRPVDALALHPAGWLGAVAFWRGELHRVREDDELVQDRLLRWVLPGLALPWLIGHLATSGEAELEFRAAAFVGTVFFTGASLTAVGLARLEGARGATGSDWRTNRSWLAMVLGIALVVTVVAIPAAALLGVPVRNLLVAILSPLQTLLLVGLLLATPIVVLAALATEALKPYLPEGFGIGSIRLPGPLGDVRETASAIPPIVFYAVVAVIVALELFILGYVVWVRWQERRRMRTALTADFEEREIVIPPAVADAHAPQRARRARRRHDPTTPSGAYLAALDLLERDGRWTRASQETPAAHAARARGSGLAGPSLPRLAADYQLERYAAARLPPAEWRRLPRRLASLRRWLRRNR